MEPQANSHWTSKISNKAVATVVCEQNLFKAQIYFYGIAAKYNAPLQALVAVIHNER